LLQEQIKAGLAEAGIRAEIGRAHLDLGGYRVTLEDIDLYAGDGKKPFASAESIKAQFSIVSYLRRELNITQVEIAHPQIWLEYDKEGRFNLDALHGSVSKGGTKKEPVKFLTANFEVTRCEIHFDDRKRDASADVRDLYVRLIRRAPQSGEDTFNHNLEFGFDSGDAVYMGRAIHEIKAHIRKASVIDSSAQIDEFDFSSDLGGFAASGAIESVDPLAYSATIADSNFRLDRIGQVFALEAHASGAARFTGRIDGTGIDYAAKGNIRSDALGTEFARVEGLRAAIEVNGKGSDYHGSCNLETAAVLAEQLRIAGVSVKTKVHGSGAEYNGTADLSAGAVSGRNVSVSSVRLGGAAVKGKGPNFNLAGALDLTSLQGGAVTVSDLRGRLEVDAHRVSLSGFTATTLGGSVQGSAAVALGKGESEVNVEFKSIDLDKVATVAAARDVAVRGNASGVARLTFPGFDYKAAKGTIDAAFDAAVSPAQSDAEPAAAQGQVSLTATGSGFNVERAVVHSLKSDVTVTGSIAWNGDAALSVAFKSADMSEIQRAVEAFGLRSRLIPQEETDQYEVALAGPGEFAGRVEGALGGPNISGHLRLDGIRVHQEEVGSFEGDVNYSSSEIRVENAMLVRPDGSRADFNLDAPLDQKDAVSIKATVQGFDLPAIVRAASPSLSDIVGRGTIDGEIDLKGLPGPRTIHGVAKVTLSAGEFNLPANEEGQDATRVSVPEFRGDVTIADSVISVQNLRMRAGDSDVSGQGSFNLDTYAYSINAQGKNLDLARVSNAVSEKVRLTGTADVNLVGKGEWGKNDDWSNLNLNATIQGQNVALNGRDLGNAKLVAFTESGLLKLEASGNVLDQMRTLAATIDLRDRKNYPINASLEFTDTDIGPYLGLILPGLAGISGRATGTIKLSGPLQEPDQVTAVANLSKLEIGGPIAERQSYTIANQGNVVITASPTSVALERVAFTGEGTSITLEGAIARDPAAKSSLRLDGDLDLRFLSSFTPTIFTTGVAQVRASVVGPLDAPQLLGVVNLKDIGVRIVNVPLSMAHGSGQIRFTADQALVENFAASTPGGGTLSVQGGAALSGLAPDRWRLEITLSQVGVEYPRDTQTVADATLALQGNRRAQVLSGNAEVRRAAYTRNLTLEELITTGGPFSPGFLEAGPGGSGGPSGLPTALDVRVTADNTLIVKDNLADAVGSAYLNIRGSLDEPAVSGRILLSRGTLEFRNGRFDLTRGVVTLPGGRRNEPVLDFQSEADITGYHITANFNGPLSKLQTTLRSDPELPETDIVSLVLTGNVSGDRTTVGAVTQTGLGLAQSILSASLSEQLEKGTQRLFGLSRFSIDPLLVGRGSDPTARITVGQRITKDLTVTYSQNLTSGPAGLDRVVLVEYRLSNRFSVVGYRNERGELGFDVRLRKRF